MIPLKWKLYTLVALAFVLGLLGIRAKLITEGESRMRDKIEAKRRQAIEEANEVRNEVEALDRDTLQSRARRWVRGSKR